MTWSGLSLQGPRDLYIVARERKRGTVLAVCRSTQCNYPTLPSPRASIQHQSAVRSVLLASSALDIKLAIAETDWVAVSTFDSQHVNSLPLVEYF